MALMSTIGKLYDAVVLCAILAACAELALAGSSNSLMDISPDGHFLACANRDSGTVSVIKLGSLRKVREVDVGTHPEGVTFVGNSRTVAAAVYADDKIVFIDADTGERIGAAEVLDEPYGVVANASGSKVYATLEYPGQVVEIDAVSMAVVRTFAAGRFPRGIALTADERRLLISEYYTATVLAIDIETGEEVDRWTPSGTDPTDNLARQVVVHPKRPKAYLPHIRSRVSTAHGEGAIFPYVSVVDIGAGEEDRRKRIPMDAFRDNFVVANPWEVGVSPDGRHLYAIFSGTNDMFACDTVDDDYTEISLREYVKLGLNPRAVRVSPDNQTVYVYNALDFTVVAYDAERLEPVGTVSVSENPLGEEILLGKILFYSALQPMVGRRWISCSSCHPDGDPDGRTWNNPEGLRATPPLFGLAWTHPLHWSADRDETQDFEHTIRGLLMQGGGLIKGEVNASLEAPNKGASRELDALAAYTNAHRFTLSPHAKGGLSEAAQRGKEIFFSSGTRCSSCHAGVFYTDSTPAQTILRHDVGTGNDDPGEKMGPAYDTPTLLGIYRSAPYLHHGKAATLKEVLVEYNAGDKHGKTSHLSPTQASDLVEFLKSLPYEDPEPLARKAGMTKVEGGGGRNRE
jgi:YVTN family beta-propeller protein